MLTQCFQANQGRFWKPLSQKTKATSKCVPKNGVQLGNNWPLKTHWISFWFPSCSKCHEDHVVTHLCLFVSASLLHLWAPSHHAHLRGGGRGASPVGRGEGAQKDAAQGGKLNSPYSWAEDGERGGTFPFHVMYQNNFRWSPDTRAKSI